MKSTESRDVFGRIARAASTTLYVVVSREDLHLSKPSVEFVSISDHVLVKWTLNIKKPDIAMWTTRAGIGRFSKMMRFVPNSPLFSWLLCDLAFIGDVDTITAFYNSTISFLLNKHAPPTDVTYCERRSNEWFDNACQEAKTQARYLERGF
jgi:hypothetical protein